MIMKADWLANNELEELGLFINQRYGLEFLHQRLELLHDAVQKRLEVCKTSTVREYLHVIQQQEEEALQLVNLLTIHETYFFREAIHFEVMTMQAIPKLVKNGGKIPFIRLLSAGCSTGEEAYSMAMAILKMPGAGVNWDFEIIGVDIDKEAIRKAKTGVYSLYSFRSCPAEIKDNYFEPLSKEWFKIKSFVKEKVRFVSLNLFEQVYPDWMENMDIIFYRNVSIYFSKEQREEIFRRLAGLLTKDGYLFLSCTETLYHNNNLMLLVKNGEAFYYKKKDPAAMDRRVLITKPIVAIHKQCPMTHQPRQTRKNLLSQVKQRLLETMPQKVRPSLASHQDKLPIASQEALCQQMFITTLELVKLKKYDEAISKLDEMIVIDSYFIKAYTLKANILLNQQRVAATIELCQAVLAMDTFCLEAYLLLGMAAKTVGEMEIAVQRFKEAIYVNPECWLAHFFLAQVYQIREESPYAKREYEVAMRILLQGNFENHGLSFFLVPFQLDDFIRLCQHNITKL